MKHDASAHASAATKLAIAVLAPLITVGLAVAGPMLHAYLFLDGIVTRVWRRRRG